MGWLAEAAISASQQMCAGGGHGGAVVVEV
jgi:hypothetical protein